MVRTPVVINTEEDVEMRRAVVIIDSPSFSRALRLSATALSLKAEGITGVDVSAKTMITLTVDGTMYHNGWIVVYLTDPNTWRGAALVAYGYSSHSENLEGGYHFVIVDLDTETDDLSVVTPRQETTTDRVADFGDNAWLYLM